MLNVEFLNCKVTLFDSIMTTILLMSINKQWSRHFESKFVTCTVMTVQLI
jgi:hypothetical protein